MTKNSSEGKKFTASFKINIPEKLNNELETELTKQLDVNFKKDKTDKPRTKPDK